MREKWIGKLGSIASLNQVVNTHTHKTLQVTGLRIVSIFVLSVPERIFYYWGHLFFSTLGFVVVSSILHLFYWEPGFYITHISGSFSLIKWSPTDF